MDLDQVMEIWCPSAKAVGSGYLIAENLVLTAWHVVRGTELGGPVRVRRLDGTGQTRWLSAELCWQPVSEDDRRSHDAALVRIIDPAWQPLQPQVVRFGRIDGTRRLRCEGVGFPEAARLPGPKRRGYMPVRGHFEPLFHDGSGLLTVHVDVGIVPRRTAHGSGWAGSSGAALFSGRHLVAVLAVDRDVADTAEVLQATPVAVLMRQPGFSEALALHGAPRDLHEVTEEVDQQPRIGPVAPAAFPRELRGLPRRSAVFTGRDQALAQLLELLEPQDAGASLSAVAVITGLPGVGKTELAVQAAHAALARDWFPGGTLFIDARGYEQDRAMTADAALDHMLRSLGVASEEIPVAEHRAQFFGTLMEQYAAAGRRILVVIDNVASSAVAEALVPAVGCALVTSRHTLARVRARRIDLQELSRSAAVAMLDGELREAHGADTRVGDQHQDAVEIVQLCGELPLAVHIVAALLGEDGSRPLSSMAEDLRGSSTRLDELRYREDVGGVPGVQAAFDLSYRQLDPEQARVLRLLRVNPGPEVSTEAVAAMTQLELRTARRRLEELRTMHLIRAAEPYGRHGRWRMHNLIAVYVSGLPAGSADLKLAFMFLLLHYTLTTQQATELLDPAGARDEDNPFADRAQALAWLDTEYANLTPLAHVFVAEPAFARTLTVDLSLSLWRYLELRRRTEDWIDFCVHTLTVVRALGDRAREAEALTKFGNALRQARRYDESLDACREAVTIQRELGNPHGEGVALNNLAATLLETREHDQVVAVARQAAAIFEQTDDRLRQAIALNNLAGALMRTGCSEEGMAAYEQAASIVDTFDDMRLKGAMLTNLGDARHRGGTGPEVLIELYRQAHAAMAQAGDRHGEGTALTNLAAALLLDGRTDEAIAAAGEAAAVLRESDDPQNLGAALTNLGSALHEAGRFGEAVDARTEALAVYRCSGDHEAVADAAISLGIELQGAADLSRAVSVLQDSVQACRERGDRRGQSRACRYLGSVLWQGGHFERAVVTLRTAVALARETGDRGVQAKALMFLAPALMVEHVDEALLVLAEAAELYRRLDRTERAMQALMVRRSAEAVKRARENWAAQLAAGRFEEIIAEFRASTARLGSHPGIDGLLSRNLGLLLNEAGRWDQAIAFLEAAAAAFHQVQEIDQARAAHAAADEARAAQDRAKDAALALERELRHAEPDSPRLRAAVQAAVGHLGAHDARLLRLLAAGSGTDVSLEAAAVLAFGDRDVIRTRLKELSLLASEHAYTRLLHRMSVLYRDDLKSTRAALDALTGMRLLQHDGDPRRWRLPTAVRSLAAEESARHAAADMRREARTLLHLYYLAAAHAVGAPLDAGPFAPLHSELQAQGFTWLQTEYSNLVATVLDARNDDIGAVIAMDVTRAMTHIMGLGHRNEDAVRLGRIALRAARRLHDRPAEAVVTRNLAAALLRAGEVEPSIAMLRQALVIHQESGDRHGEGTTLSTLGAALTHAGQFTDASTALRTAVEIHRQQDNAFSEAAGPVQPGSPTGAHRPVRRGHYRLPGRRPSLPQDQRPAPSRHGTAPTGRVPSHGRAPRRGRHGSPKGGNPGPRVGKRPR
nr:tetratricopeptide repeat protein [Streptacidiphilus jeojiense]